MDLKYLVNHATNMCYHLDFVVPFLEHRLSRFSIILKDLRIFQVVNKHWLQLDPQPH